MGRGEHSEGRTGGATTLGLRPWRAGRPELLARGRRRPGALVRGVDAPAGVSATAALDRSPRPPGLRCPRRGSIESSSLPGRAARRALGKHRSCLRGDTGAGRSRGAGVCVCVSVSLGPRVLVSSPGGSASAGRELREQLEGIPPPQPPLYPGVGGRDPAGEEPRGVQPRSPPQFPHLGSDPKGLRDSPPSFPTCFPFLCAQPAGRRSGAGRGTESGTPRL